MRPWRKIDSRALLRDPVHLDEDVVLLPDGRQIEYVVMREGSFVCVCPVTTDGRVGLITQYRYPLAAFTHELPSGAVENGETPLDAARREVSEEAGLTGGTWDAMGTFWTMPGRSNQSAHLFLAQDVVQTGSPSGEEETELVLVTFDEALALVSSTRDALCLRLALERL
jgi:8-oxo-dGTP pyrophosphatase MutT (NUDIX family)